MNQTFCFTEEAPLTACAIKERAFTLIELLVVILVIGILIAIAAPTFLGQQGKAKDSAAKQALGVGYKDAKASATDREGLFTDSTCNTSCLASAIQASEPQFGTVGTAADTSTQTTGQLTVITPGTVGNNLSLAYLSASGNVCTLTVTNGGPQAVSCAPPVPTYASVVRSDSPTAYYKFDEASGTTAADSSGASRNASYVGSPTLGQGSLVTHDSGTATSFNSGSQYARSTAVPSVSSSFSVEGWVRLAGTPGGGAMIGAATQGSNVNTQQSYGLYISTGSMFPNTNPRCSVGATSVANADSPVALTVGVTYHVACTYDGSALRLYINGNQVASTNVSSTFTQLSPVSADSGDFLNGRLDEVAFYSTALSAARIQAHYQAGS
jgi:prepilin-type N-terminal cleavage/methylation domain-containing protein